MKTVGAWAIIKVVGKKELIIVDGDDNKLTLYPSFADAKVDLFAKYNEKNGKYKIIEVIISEDSH